MKPITAFMKAKKNATDLADITTQVIQMPSYKKQGSEADDTARLQRAINDISGKAILNLSNQTLVISDNINIAVGNLKIINGKITTTSKKAINITKDNVSIENIEFENISVVVGDFAGSYRVSDFYIKDCKATASVSNVYPVDLKCAKDSIIDNVRAINTLGDRTGSGIRLHNDSNPTTGLLAQSENIIVRNCRADGFNKGIECLGTGVRLKFVVENNYITNCNTGIDMYHCYGNKCRGNRINQVGVGIWHDSGGIDVNSLPTVFSDNQINNCTGLGIYMEEIRNGVVTNNVIMDCGEEGILLSAGNESVIVSHNNILKCNIGIAVNETKAPALIQSSWNLGNSFINNTIQNCKKHGIFINDHKRILNISDNLINANNTVNIGCGLGIYIRKASDVIVIKNNILDNRYVSSLVQGYQQGIVVCMEMAADESDVTTTNSVERLNVLNNFVGGTTTHKLVIGAAGISNGDNTAGIISNNVFTGLGREGFGTPSMVSNNLGFAGYSISQSKEVAFKINKGLDAIVNLPAASNTYWGSVTKVLRTATTPDLLYTCIRKADGSYAWIQLNSNEGKYIGNGNGTTSISFPHNLGIVPNMIDVREGSLDAGSAQIKYVTADATNITVNFINATTTGTNNIVLYWRAKL